MTNMKKNTNRVISLILSVCTLLAMIPAVCLTAVAETVGNVSDAVSVKIGESVGYPAATKGSDGFYTLNNDTDLRWFAQQVNGGTNTAIKVRLGQNVTLSSTAWTPVKGFTGEFDGNGYTVSNMLITVKQAATMPENIGFFGEITNGNVKIYDLKIGGTINIEYSVKGVGGVVGKLNNAGASVKNCESFVNITSTSPALIYYIGGVVGWGGAGTVEECGYSGTISLMNTQADCAGGIVAYSNGQLLIKNCDFSGTVKSDLTTAYNYQMGGILGYINTDTFKGIEGCLSRGTLTVNNGGKSYVGAICGRFNTYASMTGVKNNCYYSTIGFTAEGTASTHKSGAVKIFAEAGSKVVSDGELCYLLNGSTAGAWRQTLGTDAVPVTNSTRGTVYKGYYYDSARGRSVLRYGNVSPDSAVNVYSAPTLNNNGTSNTSDDYYEIASEGQLIWFTNKVNSGSGSISAVLGANIGLNPGYVMTYNGDTGMLEVCSDYGADRYICVNTDTGFDTDPTTSGVQSPELGKKYVFNGAKYIPDISVVESFNTFTPIGSTSANAYSGNFSFNGKCISGMYVSGSVSGLFGYVSGATVTGACVKNSVVIGSGSVGGVVGRMESGSIVKADCAATVIGTGNAPAGGICGTFAGTLKESVGKGVVSSAATSGGLVGTAASGTIESCFSIASVLCEASAVGALCGSASGVTMSKCAYLKGVAGANVYALGGSASDDTSKVVSVSDFTTGEACWFLNGGVTNGTQVFYQTIGSGYPDFSDNTVYRAYNACDGEYIYGNSPVSDGDFTHDYVNGICTKCNSYQPATLVNGYYEIGNSGQLFWFAKLVNDGNGSANGRLVSDIVVNADLLDEDGLLSGGTLYAWTPIGTAENQYGGTFEGGYHTVSGLTISSSTKTEMGLFGVTNGAEIKNLGVIDSYFRGNHIGGIAGVAFSSTFTSCYSDFAGYANDGIMGGICASMDGGYINNCVTTAANLYGEGNSMVISGSESGLGKADMLSGKATYLLNGRTSVNVGWYQTAGTGFPSFDSAKGIIFYGYTSCAGGQTYTNGTVYANQNDAPHSYSDKGICPVCLNDQPAEYNHDEGYYAIGNRGQLNWFLKKVNSRALSGGMVGMNAKLTGDIDMEGDSGATIANEYYGVFDGNKHVIKGTAKPLFNIMNGTVSNLGIEDVAANLYNQSALCTENNGNITNCYVVTESSTICDKNNNIIISCYTGVPNVGAAYKSIPLCNENLGRIENSFFFSHNTDSDEEVAIISQQCGGTPYRASQLASARLPTG